MISGVLLLLLVVVVMVVVGLVGSRLVLGIMLMVKVVWVLMMLVI